MLYEVITKSSGEIEFDQIENKLTGILNITESDDEGQLLQVRIHLQGKIIDNCIYLKSTDATITNGPADTVYYLDNYEGCLNSEGKILGSSVDEQGVCGIFVIERAS